MNLSAHGRALRTGRYSRPGNIYLLTTVTHRRRPLFGEYQCARCLIAVLQREQRECHASTLAFVVMPDHLHWLVQLDQGDLPALMNRVKGRSSRALSRLPDGLAVTGRVWQDGYHDHGMRTDESLRNAARYIVANPLRAGLCQHVAAYPHWDAAWLYGRDVLPLRERPSPRPLQKPL